MRPWIANRPRPFARIVGCTAATLAAGRRRDPDLGTQKVTGRDRTSARSSRTLMAIACCTPTLRTEIVRERWRASRLPSLRSALRDLDPRHALPQSGHLSERRRRILDCQRRGKTHPYTPAHLRRWIERPDRADSDSALRVRHGLQEVPETGVLLAMGGDVPWPSQSGEQLERCAPTV